MWKSSSENPAFSAAEDSASKHSPDSSGTAPTRCRSCFPTWSAPCATPTSVTTRPRRRHDVQPAVAARSRAARLPALCRRPVRRRDQGIPGVEDQRRFRLAARPLADHQEQHPVRQGGQQPRPLGPRPRRRAEGRQHHILDLELFGPNSRLTGFTAQPLERRLAQLGARRAPGGDVRGRLQRIHRRRHQGNPGRHPVSAGAERSPPT